MQFLYDNCQLKWSVINPSILWETRGSPAGVQTMVVEMISQVIDQVWSSTLWEFVPHLPLVHQNLEGDDLRSDRYYGLFHSRVLKANEIPGSWGSESVVFHWLGEGSTTSFAFKGWVKIGVQVIWYWKDIPPCAIYWIVWRRSGRLSFAFKAS